MQMVNARTGSQSSHGGAGSTWSGMPCTSPDMFAPSYLQSVTSAAETVAAVAENRKKDKYRCLRLSLLIHSYCYWIIGSLWPTNPTILEGSRQPPQADHGGGKLVQVPPPEIVGGSPKRQSCIGPRNNYPFLHPLHVSTCMRAPLIAVYYIPYYTYIICTI